MMAQSSEVFTKDEESKKVMDSALKVLGSRDKIGGIKSLILKGTEISNSNNKFEIWILLPNNFLQIQKSSGVPHHMSISGRTILPQPTLIKNGKISNEPDNEDMARYNIMVNGREDFWSYFLIGLLAKAGPTPLTLSYNSTKGVFILVKNDDEIGEIEFDSQNGYPIVVRYKTTVGNGDIRFDDRFYVEGIMFPKIITINYGIIGLPNKKLQIDEVKINPKLSLKDYEPFKEYKPYLLD